MNNVVKTIEVVLIVLALEVALFFVRHPLLNSLGVFALADEISEAETATEPSEDTDPTETMPTATPSPTDIPSPTPTPYVEKVSPTTEETEVTAIEDDSSDSKGMPGKKQYDKLKKKYSFTEEKEPCYFDLTEAQQKAYLFILDGINSAKEHIELGDYVGIKDSECELVWNAVYCDHPECFWIENQVGWHYNGITKIVTTFEPGYNDLAADLEGSKAKFSEAAEKILTGAREQEEKGVFYQELYVHDKICELCTYDLKADHDQSGYGCLVEGKAVCNGYARAFQYLMKQLDIPTYYLAGDAYKTATCEGGRHAWNIIMLDGKAYTVDVTWDDTDDADVVRHEYMNVTDKKISESRKRDKEFESLPECVSTDMNYEVVTGEAA